jgi:hypothetical protein
VNPVAIQCSLQEDGRLHYLAYNELRPHSSPGNQSSCGD